MGEGGWGRGWVGVGVVAGGLAALFHCCCTVALWHCGTVELWSSLGTLALWEALLHIVACLY